MSRIRKIGEEYLEVWLFAVIFLVFSIVMPVFANISMKNGLSYFIFQAGGIMLPGMAVMILFPWKGLSRLDFVTLSYGCGYGLNILLYYLTAPFMLQNYMRYFILLEAIVSIVIVVLKRENWKNYDRDWKGSFLCAGFIIVLLGIEMFVVCAANFFPPNVQENVLYHDMLYWIGNTITLKNGYPAVSFREYPAPYTYHFFSSMQLAVVSLTTNIRPVILGFTFYFIQPVFLMVTGAWMLLRRVSGRRWLIAVAILILFFTEGKADWTKVTYMTHLLVIQFGFEISIGFYMLFFWCMLMQIRQKIFDWKLCILSIFFFMITLGSKSSFGAIALCAAGIICLCWLFKKQLKNAFGYGIPILASFVLMYIFVVNLGSSDQPESSIIQTFLTDVPTIYKVAGFLGMTRENLLAVAGNHKILQIMMHLINGTLDLLLSQYCIYIPFFYLLFMRIFKTKKWDILDSACLGSIIVGTLVTLNWGNPDSSVAYFMMATYVPAVLLSIREVECLIEEGAFRIKFRKALLVLTIGILCVFGVRDAYYHTNGLENIQKGLVNINEPERTANRHDRAFISSDDYAAYEWIRCNTQEDTLITANVGLQRGREESSRHSRVPGVFTERYVIGNDDTDCLFYDLDYSKIDQLRESGIQYVIYNQTSTENFVLPEEKGESVYSNATNTIYRLQ